MSNDIEYQEKINEANKILKDAEKKLKLAEQREKDSEAINELIKNLDEKSKTLSEMQKNLEKAMSLATEREHLANLLIEQYTKRLEEIGGIKEEKLKKKK